MSEFVTVDIPQGRLEGRKVTSPTTGHTYYSFQGVPYAQPPVGPLRFKPPQEVEAESWVAIRDAIVEESVAPQTDLLTNKYVGNEDCLYLNVYTPEWPAQPAKAVMVWIHGGGFSFGSGNTDIYGPDFLVAEDVILVTINYRLGLLGFLYLEGADVTGNNGLRDQLMALKWVKNNISNFGGDPGNVTIFGESAGGFSTHFLTLIPQAAGLMHRAIVQSATALLPGCLVSSEVGKRRTRNLARLLGCSSEDPQELVDFLRTVPAEEIVATQMSALLEGEDLAAKIPPFLPCMESGPDALITESFRTLLEEGRFTKVPFMTGVTSADGNVLLGHSPKETLRDIDKNFKAVVPLDLDHKLGSEITAKIADSMRKFYFEDKPVDEETIVNYIDMQTDLFFVYPMYQAVQLQLRSTHHPVYVYLYDHKSPAIINSFPIIDGNFPGAPHSAELPYLFQSSVKPNKFPPGSPDTEVQHNMVKLWTQFAKTGNPTTEADSTTWAPATTKTFNYLKIDGRGLHLETNIYKPRVDFLTNLYNTYQPQKEAN